MNTHLPVQSLIADMELGGGLKLGKVGNHKFWLLHGVLQILEAHNLGLLHLIRKEFIEYFYGQESTDKNTLSKIRSFICGLPNSC